MAEPFNALYKWLGIPPEEQPPTHYRLLGLSPFESDPDVISNAADQRMAHIRTFQSGQHGKVSQRILNQIAVAKSCLMNPRKKAEYDDALHSKMPPPLLSPGMHAAARSLQMPPLPTMTPPLGSFPQGAPIPAPPGTTAPIPLDSLAPVQAVAANPIHAAVEGRAPTIATRYTRQRGNNHAALAILLMLTMLAAGAVAAVFIVQPWKEREIIQPTSGANVKVAPASKTTGGSKPSATGTKNSTPGGETKSPDPSEPPSDTARTPAGKSGGSPADIQSLLELLAPQNRHALDAREGPAGNVAGDPFDDLVLDGALLAGFDFCLDDSGKSIQTLRGLVLTTRGYRTTAMHGKPGSKLQRVVAKSGYAVGAVNVAVGDQINGLEVVFMRVLPDKLDPKDTYKSEWIGGPASKPVALDGHGKPVLGIFGSSNADGVLQLGLILPGEEGNSGGPKPEAAPTENPATSSPSAAPISQTPATPATAPEPAPVAPLPPGVKQPVPSAEAQSQAMERIHHRHQREYESLGTAAEKLALAQRLLRSANRGDDPAHRYCALVESIDLGTKAGDSQVVLQALDALATGFAIDEKKTTLGALEELEKAQAPAAEKRKLTDGLMVLVDKAAARDDYSTAELLGALARKSVRKTNDMLLNQQITWRLNRVREQHTAFQAAEKGRETLKSHPEDPDANFAVGRYLAFYRDDWKAGLPLLVKSGRDPLKDAAQQELAHPADAAAQARLGDAWWQSSEVDAPFKSLYQRRARHWYQLALANKLDGPGKEMAERNLAAMLAGHGLTAEYFTGPIELDHKLLVRIDPAIDFDWSQTPAAPELPREDFAVRWTGFLAVPTSGQYQLLLDARGGRARLSIDGTLTLDVAGEKSVHDVWLPMTRKPRAIVIEFFSEKSDARFSFRWAQKDGFLEQPVPTEALYHDADAAQKGFSALP